MVPFHIASRSPMSLVLCVPTLVSKDTTGPWWPLCGSHARALSIELDPPLCQEYFLYKSCIEVCRLAEKLNQAHAHKIYLRSILYSNSTVDFGSLRRP